MDIEISDHDDNEDVVVHGALPALGLHAVLCSPRRVARRTLRAVCNAAFAGAQSGDHSGSAQRVLLPTHGSSFGIAAYRLVWSGPNKPIAPTKVKAKKTKDSDEMVEAVTPPQRSAGGTQGTHA